MAKKGKGVFHEEISKIISQGESFVLKDDETESKALLPVAVSNGYNLEIVKIDKGLIADIPEGKFICDNLIYSMPMKKDGIKITWLVELKGTKVEQVAKHAIDQIMDTISFLLDEGKYPDAAKYLKKRDLVFCLVVGSPDKTLPSFMRPDIKQLCQRLMKHSLQRSKIKDIYSLFFCIQPRKTKKVNCSAHAPYTITCYNSRGCEIAFPKMFTDLVFKDTD